MQIQHVAQHTSPLRAARLARGLSLRSAARAARIDAGHLSRVERGQACLGGPALARLARVLGLDDVARLLTPHIYQDTAEEEVA